MDIATLLNNRPSLSSYLGQKGSNTTPFQAINSSRSQNSLASTLSASGSVNISLSIEAQRIMDEYQVSQQNTEEQPEHIQDAKQHFISFFKDTGIDFENLSSEASEFFTGIFSVIESTNANGRDTTTDSLERNYSNGDRNTYTLSGNDRRLRIAIEKQEDGTEKLLITDIQGNTGDIAEITINNEDDAFPTINVERLENLYQFGRRISSNELTPLSIKT